jgi:hypothetical protein
VPLLRGQNAKFVEDIIAVNVALLQTSISMKNT